MSRINNYSDSEEVKEKFFALKTKSDVAELLFVSKTQLIFNIYVSKMRYHSFTIKKKAGGDRSILTPIPSLKYIQQNLNQVLQLVYQVKPSVHGFVYGRSIVTNAGNHNRKKSVLNIDIKDFFPSINFGRVRGMFLGNPYFCNEEVATILAQICCYDNQLPQGAPTSPIVANMICARLDAKLQQLAKKHKCTYTRYADDITFSTSQIQFPPAIVVINSLGELSMGNELHNVIDENHFQINPLKIRLQTKNRRQEVTGLTVNKFPNVSRLYIDRIRGLLHAWERYGFDAVEKRFQEKYDCRHRRNNCQGGFQSSQTNINVEYHPSLKRVVEGKIEFISMVRGKENPIYRRLRRRFIKLAPEFKRKSDNERKSTGVHQSIIVTEGVTDKKHLIAALRHLQSEGKFLELKLNFDKITSDEGGAEKIISLCESFSTQWQPSPTIFIFDRDIKRIVEKVTTIGKDYKDWGNNIYSFAIPIPENRENIRDICIEFYYLDEDLKREDGNGRRLFTSDEFNKLSGRHKTGKLTYPLIRSVRDRIKLIDDEVFNEMEENMALSKNEFADCILESDPAFLNINFSQFQSIFVIIEQIASQANFARENN